MKKIYVLIILVAGFIITSCNQDDPNIKGTETKAFAGEWFVTYSVDGVDINGGHSKIITSNTAANIATEIMVSDYVEANATFGNFWSFKIKAQADPAAYSLVANEAESNVLVTSARTPYETKVNLLNGKIFKNGGLSKTGVTVDSIYFELQFEDDTTPYGTTYVVSGHKRTGFAADEY
jgi:hypothetical protein